VKPLYRLFPLFLPQWRLVAICQLGLLVATALNLLGPLLVAHAIDVEIPQGDKTGLIRIAVFFFGVLLLNVLLNYSSRIGSEIAAQGAMYRLKKKLFSHLLGHDLAFHDKQNSGRLITRVQGDTDSLRVLFTEVVLQLPADLFLFVGMIAITAHRAPSVLWLLLAVLPIYIVLFLIFRRVSRPYFMAVRKVASRLTGFLNEHIRAMPSLQLFGRTQWARSQADEILEEVYDKEVIAHAVPIFYFNALFFVRGIAVAGVLFFGAKQVSRGELTVGSLVMALGYLRLMFNPLMRISFHQATVERARAAAVRIIEILDDAPVIVDAEDPADWRRLEQGIRFDAVRFSYGEEEVLRGVDLFIPAGSNSAVVGATGSGKSTLVNLLLRFREPQSGRILLDDQSLEKIRLADLRDKSGLVQQDVLLFPGTVLDNLGGDPVAAQLALDLLGLSWSLDKELPHAGASLSRGERQLLTFARALVRDPELLVLDEATSAVDPATEERIQSALERLQEGRTTLSVAHRLVTIRRCNPIFVMASGQLVEQGSHESLLQEGGIYANLWALQSGEVSQ